jgi:hypothetical protein
MTATKTITLYVVCPCGISRHIKGVAPDDADNAKRIVRNIGWIAPRLKHSPDLRARGIIAVEAICPECEEMTGDE